MEVEFGYLVRLDLPSRQWQVDRPGIRVAVQQNSGPDAFFTRTLKDAVVIRASSNPAALETVKSGGADVMGSIKPVLCELSPQLPGSQVLEGRPGIDPHAMAMPKGRLGLGYARQFIESAKSGGLVKAAIERARVCGVVVAPLNDHDAVDDIVRQPVTRCRCPRVTQQPICTDHNAAVVRGGADDEGLRRDVMLTARRI